MGIKSTFQIVISFLIGFSAVAQNRITYHWQDVDGVNIFYRKAGDPSKPALVLFHGTPSSSIMYQDLIRLLKDDFYLIAPDYPAHGYSDTPAPAAYSYTFENITKTMDAFLAKIGVNHYSIYMQDYGAPVGFRLALLHPDRVEALVIQNGNAYMEGFPLAQDENGDLQKYWKDKNKAFEKEWMDFYSSLKLAGAGTWRHGESVSPDRRALDVAVMQKPGTLEIFRDLWFDYGNNVKAYPTWQAYLKQYQPPTLVMWGFLQNKFKTQRIISDGENFYYFFNGVQFTCCRSNSRYVAGCEA